MRGIDVSENNGEISEWLWKRIVDSGIEFVMIRLGYGNGHLDSQFYKNYNLAKEAGLKVGVYYYDYGLDEQRAIDEATYCVSILKDAGITPDDLEMGIYFDMEDADGWKERHGMPSNWTITAMCDAFAGVCTDEGYSIGIYASLDWLENVIDHNSLPDYIKYWVAHWASWCGFEKADLWQITDSYAIGGQFFDYNEEVE